MTAKTREWISKSSSDVAEKHGLWQYAPVVAVLNDAMAASLYDFLVRVQVPYTVYPSQHRIWAGMSQTTSLKCSPILDATPRQISIGMIFLSLSVLLFDDARRHPVACTGQFKYQKIEMEIAANEMKSAQIYASTGQIISTWAAWCSSRNTCHYAALPTLSGDTFTVAYNVFLKFVKPVLKV